MDMTVNENEGTITVCLMKNITTAGPITVVFDAEEETGVPNPASGKYKVCNVAQSALSFCMVHIGVP